MNEVVGKGWMWSIPAGLQWRSLVCLGNFPVETDMSHSVAHRHLHTLKLEVQSELSFHMEEGSSDKSFLVMGWYIYEYYCFP